MNKHIITAFVVLLSSAAYATSGVPGASTAPAPAAGPATNNGTTGADGGTSSNSSATNPNLNDGLTNEKNNLNDQENNLNSQQKDHDNSADKPND